MWRRWCFDAVLKVLDLFSGIGGFSLGLERTGGFETVAFCEIDPFCRKVLAKHWPDVPIHKDVRGLTGDAVGPIDVITGGYPCQPFSLAGKRQGADDDRHLWPEMFRLVASIRPRWIIAENVPGHINMGLDQVLSDLEGEGYTTGTLIIPACAVDAPHRRDRLWIVANNDLRRQLEPVNARKRREGMEARELEGDSAHAMAHTRRNGKGSNAQLHRDAPQRTQGKFQPGNGGEDVADAISAGQSHSEGRQTSARRNRSGTADNTGCRSRGGAVWLPEPPVGRVVNGVPNRVDRLKCLGNAVLPQIPEIIGRAILDAEKINLEG